MTDKIVGRWIFISVVMLLAAWALVANPLEDQLGIDLRGGVTLTYSVDRESIAEMRDAQTADQTSNPEAALDDTVRVISARINSLGVKDLSVRREGERRILIQAPKMSDGELEEIKSRMVQLGALEFPIGMGVIGGERKPTPRQIKPDGTSAPIAFDEAKANAQLKARIEKDWPRIQDAVAKGLPIPEDAYRPGTPYTYVAEDGNEVPSIVWKPWSPGEAANKLSADYHEKANPQGIGRKGLTSEDVQRALSNAQTGKDYDPELIIGGWLYYDPEYYGPGKPGFTGRDISNVRRDYSRTGARAVNYTVNRDRQAEFEEYTGKYVDHAKCLVLNDQIWSNPTINEALSDNVQITGGGAGFTEKEQDWLIDCLQSGSLKLRPVLESEDNVEATLGAQAVNRGILATLLGGLLVVAFMIYYYRFSGMVAVIGLLLNLALMMALLALFQATITLPGIAGIILTIGMSVDANILIFERIREELAKGKTLVSSIQAGFDRAFVTIIDANLTTVITAVILYNYGVGPIKGFAVTLMAGIACSLFTALFVSKTLFATALGKGFISDTLNMSQWVRPDLRLDFVGKAKKASVGSAIAVVASLLIFFGSDPYGLDFTGGTKVRMTIAGEQTSQDIMSKVSAIKNDEGNQLYPNVTVTRLIKSPVIDGKTYQAFDIHLQTRIQVTTDEARKRVEPALMAALGDRWSSMDEPTRDDRSGEWTFIFHLKSEDTVGRVAQPINTFKDSTGSLPFETTRVTAISPKEDDATGEITATSFRITLNEKNLIGKDEILDQLVSVFGSDLPTKTVAGTTSVDYGVAFPKLSFVGPNVVANLKQQAVVSVILSLIALILYIWFRFRELKYGFAAAVAVFHDVIVALGMVVLFNALGLVHVPINLPIIAGFLTIIGYSLNDTIVLFDRVRENLGNVKGEFHEVVNLSVNQTLARTLLTSLTTFVVVFILFVLNYGAESPIEGIAFTLLIGVLVGTYSSIFIASPVVIWLHNREEQKAAAGKKA